MSGTIHLELFKALPLVPSVRLAHRGDRSEKTHPMTPRMSPGLSQDGPSTGEGGAIITDS